MLSLASSADVNDTSTADTVQLAISTASKMLTNLYKNMNDPKLK